MPARYVIGQPTRHHGPLPEYENETVFGWIRRQNRPVKPTPRKKAHQTTFEAAVAEMVQKKKKDAEAAATARRPNPEGN